MPPPSTTTLAGRDAGDAAEQHPAAALWTLERVRAHLRGEPAGDLAHRCEQRQPAVVGLDRLVGDADRARSRSAPRELGCGREVQVGEEHLPAANARVLRRQRLLDLEHQLGVAPRPGRLAQRRRPAATYSASANADPAPASCSTTTSCPRATSSCAPAGVSATRYSSGLISLTTPIFIVRHPSTGWRDRDYRSRAASTSASTMRTMPSTSATAISSAEVWIVAHAVRQIEARAPARVEDVGVGAAAGAQHLGHVAARRRAPAPRARRRDRQRRSR